MSVNHFKYECSVFDYTAYPVTHIEIDCFREDGSQSNCYRYQFTWANADSYAQWLAIAASLQISGTTAKRLTGMYDALNRFLRIGPLTFNGTVHGTWLNQGKFNGPCGPSATTCTLTLTPPSTYVLTVVAADGTIPLGPVTLHADVTYTHTLVTADNGQFSATVAFSAFSGGWITSASFGGSTNYLPSAWSNPTTSVIQTFSVPGHKQFHWTPTSLIIATSDISHLTASTISSLVLTQSPPGSIDATWSVSSGTGNVQFLSAYWATLTF